METHLEQANAVPAHALHAKRGGESQLWVFTPSLVFALKCSLEFSTFDLYKSLKNR
jgi:hypothetical protein